MADSTKRADDVFDIDRIRKLIQLMKEYELGEIDLRQADGNGDAALCTLSSLLANRCGMLKR